MIESFNISETAEALGKSILTIRRWIDHDMLPAPFLREVGGHAVMVYSKGELEVIARVLSRHAGDYQYLCEKHDHVRHDMHQHVHAYRTQRM